MNKNALKFKRGYGLLSDRSLPLFWLRLSSECYTYHLLIRLGGPVLNRGDEK